MRVYVTALLIATVAASVAVVTKLTTRPGADEPIRIVTVNGEDVPRELFALYTRIGRSRALAAHPGSDVGAAAKSTAVEKSVSYMVQLQQARRLGVLQPDAIPFAGDNMTRLRINRSGYGARELPDAAVVEQFLLNTREAIIDKLLPPSSQRARLRARYESRRADYHQVQRIVARRIRISYSAGNRSERSRLATETRHQIGSGRPFAAATAAVAAWTEPYHTDTGFQRKDGSFVLNGREKFADPVLVQTAMRLRAGEVSEVVDDGAAFYIVSVESIQKRQLTFAEVERKLYFEYTGEEYSKMLKRWVDSAVVTIHDDAYARFPAS